MRKFYAFLIIKFANKIFEILKKAFNYNCTLKLKEKHLKKLKNTKNHSVVMQKQENDVFFLD